MRRRLSCDAGFTLVELMSVALVLTALLFIAIPTYRLAASRASYASCLQTRATVERADYLYYLEKGVYSPSFDALVVAEYLHGAPECPADGVYLWTLDDDSKYRTLGCSIHFWLDAVALFRSDLTSLEGFRVLMGRGTYVSDGTMHLVSRNYDQNRVSFGSNDWTDYRIQLDATLDKGDGYGVYYRADGATNITAYCFQFDPGAGNRFVVRTVTNGRESAPIASARMPAGYDIYDTSHQIEITVSGADHVIRVDGQIVLEFTDDTLPSGSAGLRTWDSTDASFDDISVYPVLGP